MTAIAMSAMEATRGEAALVGSLEGVPELEVGVELGGELGERGAPGTVASAGVKMG